MNQDERAQHDGNTPEGVSQESVDSHDILRAYDEPFDDEESGESEVEIVPEAELTQAPAAAAAEPAEPPPVFHNFMDALYPARAPAPKNPRIVRRFDLEAAKYDPRPAPAPAPLCLSMPAPAPQPALAAAPAAAPEKKERPRTREEARAMRNRSLRAAAGLD